MSQPAKVSQCWAFDGLGSKIPANVLLRYQKAGLGVLKIAQSRLGWFVAPSEARYTLGGGGDTP